mgnify:CR=1 FL=1
MSLSSKKSNSATVIHDYHHHIKIKWFILFILFSLLVMVMITGLGLGAMALSFKEVSSALLSPLLPNTNIATPKTENIIWNIRFPRVATSITAGMGLALGGVMLQTLLKNPMASPFTLGISSGASLGAALVIIFGFSFFGVYSIVANAFILAMAVSMLILFIGKWKGSTPTSLILSGIAIMYFFSATTTLIIYFSDVNATREVMFWTVGSLSKANWESFLFMSIALLITLPIFLWKATDLNRMMLGDETAKSLGISVEKMRIGLIFLVAFLVAIIVAFTGGISFLGLVSPHLARLLIGADHRFLIPATALIGGLLLALADIIALHAFNPVVLPVGVVTSFIGSPLFIYFILRRKKGSFSS